MITFNADEVYEMAEQIERNGARFYRKAAAAADAAAKKILLDLAAMEDDHERTFAQMRARLGEADRAETAFDADNQGALYLRAMVEGKVFDFRSDPSERLTGAESLAEVFHTAIGLEKDSIVFYLTMKETVPDSAGAERIDDVIQQEISHIATLSKQLAALG